MVDFKYQTMFEQSSDETDYRLLSADYTTVSDFEGVPVLKVAKDGLTLLAEQAFKEVSHLYRTQHLEQLKSIYNDAACSDNDKYVALELLKNAVISAEGEFPMCQDTGTAIVMGKKGQQVWTGINDEESISLGIFNAYTKNYLRYSQNAPLTMYDEVNTRCNLPAQIEINAIQGDEYRFLFIAKGGGSANKTFLYQETKAVLSPEKLRQFIKDKMKSIGTAACPPYHLVIVVGGTSAEMTLKTVKLASAGYLDQLPTEGNVHGRAFRDKKLEQEALEISQGLEIGAQFGGKYFCHDVRIIRLPRHGASCPIGVGVSCSADRHIKGKINKQGIFLEQLEQNPSRYLPESVDLLGDAVSVDLDQGMDALLKTLARYPVATRFLLSGKIVVARDIAHAKLKERLDSGKGLPQYLKDHIIYYAGPAKTPAGYASGAFGPTTAGRMDPYIPLFQEHGASLVTLAKGNRAKIVTLACQKYGGFYLGSIGGPAARLGKDCITKVEILEYEELGMEAIFMITVKDFPAFTIIDDKGHDFFEPLLNS